MATARGATGGMSVSEAPAAAGRSDAVRLVRVSSLHAGAQRLRRGWDDHWIAIGARRAAPAVLAQIDAPEARGWAAAGAQVSEAGVVMLFVGRPGERPAAVLKIATTAEARRSLRHEGNVLGALHDDPRLGGWTGMLPRPIAEGQVDGKPYVLTRYVVGRSAASIAREPAAAERVQRTAADAIGELHRRTAVTTRIEDADLDRWLWRSPVVLRAAAPALGARRTARALDRLCDAVRATLIGRSVTTGWTHGDFWLGNVLVTADGSVATGIVDWDLAGAGELPIVDLLHLIAYSRRLAERRDLGLVVREMLKGGAWRKGELSLLRAEGGDDPDAAYVRASLVLYWLRHVAGNLTQSERYARNRLWLRRNVDPIVAFCGDGPKPEVLP